MKKCIWCRGEFPKVTFNKQAHTIPQSLGGIYICEDVCDDCNIFFGSHSDNMISIEVALKEVFNISRFYLLSNDVDYKKKMGRFKSQFFDVDWNKYSMKPKLQYRLHQGFQERFARQFRKGIFKIYLEERHRHYSDALDSRFDFIREFARYNFSNYPVYYRVPIFPVNIVSSSDLFNPLLTFNSDTENLDKTHRMFEFGFVGHNFAIPTSKAYKLTYRNYFLEVFKSKHPFGNKFRYVDLVEKVDFTFNYLQTT